MNLFMNASLNASATTGSAPLLPPAACFIGGGVAFVFFMTHCCAIFRLHPRFLRYASSPEQQRRMVLARWRHAALKATLQAQGPTLAGVAMAAHAIHADATRNRIEALAETTRRHLDLIYPRLAISALGFLLLGGFELAYETTLQAVGINCAITAVIMTVDLYMGCRLLSHRIAVVEAAQWGAVEDRSVGAAPGQRAEVAEAQARPRRQSHLVRTPRLFRVFGAASVGSTDIPTELVAKTVYQHFGERTLHAAMVCSVQIALTACYVLGLVYTSHPDFSDSGTLAFYLVGVVTQYVVDMHVRTFEMIEATHYFVVAMGVASRRAPMVFEVADIDSTTLAFERAIESAFTERFRGLYAPVSTEGERQVAVGRAQVMIRAALSMMSTAITGFVLLTLPLMFSLSDNYMELVFNAAALIFLVSLKDLRSPLTIRLRWPHLEGPRSHLEGPRSHLEGTRSAPDACAAGARPSGHAASAESGETHGDGCCRPPSSALELESCTRTARTCSERHQSESQQMTERNHDNRSLQYSGRV